VKRPPRLLPPVLVRAMHARLLARFGGFDGRCDEAKLESALARAEQRVAYGDPSPSMFELAAELAFGIARNHPFTDGNKRVAIAVAEMALWKNGYEFKATEFETVAMTLALAADDIGVPEFAAWLERNSKKTPKRR